MSNNKSFWDSLGDVISFVLFIKYGLPILIVIILGFVAYQGIYGAKMDKEYKNMPNVIVTSKLTSTVCDYAREVYNKDAFSKVIGDTQNSEMTRSYSVEVDYYFIDGNKDAEEYNVLIKDELTKLYNKLNGKTIEKDQIFAETDKKSIGLSFYYPKDDGTSTYLCTARLLYSADKGFDEESYQNELNRTIVTNEKIEDAKKRSY